MNVMHLKVIFFGGAYRFKVFRACTNSFSTVFGYFYRGSYAEKNTCGGTLQRTFLKEQPFASEDGMKLGDT